MRALIQRVTNARVEVDDRIIAEIEKGLLVLIGVGLEDDHPDAEWLARKISGLRIFESLPGKMNLSVQDIGGEILAVPQFTLYSDCTRGLRPDFTQAARPEQGLALYQSFCRALSSRGASVKTGQFQAHMRVSLCNDGPVTIMIDSKNKQ